MDLDLELKEEGAGGGVGRGGGKEGGGGSFVLLAMQAYPPSVFSFFTQN